MTNEKKYIFAIDVGETISGCAITLNNQLLIGFNSKNEQIISEVMKYSDKGNIIVLVEDIRPYSGRLSMQVVNTIQFIGELKYRLKNEVCVAYVMITRGQVKKWIFDNYQEECAELIDKKISYMDEYGKKKNSMLEDTGKKAKYRRYKTKDGSLRKATFHWIDDRIVIRVMKKFWQIPEAKKFKKNEHGFKDHSWQALSLISYYVSK